MISPDYKTDKVAILTGGTFGTSLAVPLSKNVRDIVLFIRSKERADLFNATRENREVFPGVLLPRNVRATSDAREALDGAEVAFLVPKAQAMREVVRDYVTPNIGPRTIVASGSKAFEEGTNLRMLEVITQENRSLAARCAVISGPNFAHELIKGLPAAIVVASKYDKVARKVGTVLGSTQFKPYLTDDVIGVELGGILKNPIAIAAGIAEGMGLGSNASAAILNRGLREMIRLGVIMGADERTLMGLSGAGDLFLSSKPGGRNYGAGVDIGRGISPVELKNSDLTIEGLYSVESAVVLARKWGVEVPIMESLNEIINYGLKPSEAMERLMTRGMTYEDPLPVTGVQSRFCIRVLNRLLHLWQRRVKVEAA